MALIKVRNKNGTVYVYESTAQWNKELHQSRSTRKLLGILNEETGEIQPTGKRGPKPKEETARLYEAVRPSDQEDLKEQIRHLKAENRELKEKLDAVGKKLNIAEKELERNREVSRKIIAMLG